MIKYILLALMLTGCSMATSQLFCNKCNDCTITVAPIEYNITTDFNTFERGLFISANCKFTTVDTELFMIYSMLHSIYPEIKILSSVRCEPSNTIGGGAKNSKHLIGKAMDIRVNDNKSAYILLDKIYPDRLGLILYNNNRVHIDVRDSKWRDIIL